jgi:hypothetical protein
MVGLVREADQIPAEAVPTATSTMTRALVPVTTRVLDLQHAAGNRAVGYLLRRKKDPIDKGRVSQEVEEELLGMSPEGETKVHWTSTYGFEITDDEVIGIVKLKMSVHAGVTETQASEARQGARKEFQRLLDGKFKVVETGTIYDTRRTLRLAIDWVDDADDAHAVVQLHPGPPTTSEGTDKSNWHVEEPHIVHAHETAHLFGLLDEYVESAVKGRAHAGDANVFTDNSIMGAYPTEGVTKAAMKDRHALRIAKMIYAASNRPTSNLKVEPA